MAQEKQCDVCGEPIKFSPLVKGLPRMRTVSDCGHIVTLTDHERIVALEAQNRVLLDALNECEEYFESKADMDYNGVRYVGNDAMNMLTTVRDAIARAGGR